MKKHTKSSRNILMKMGILSMGIALLFYMGRVILKYMYHDMFIDMGLDVSWRDLEIDVTKRNTSRIFKPEKERIGHVIDHIMYNPEKVKAVDGEIVELEEPLSDHKPVWALLELKMIK